MLTSMLPAPSAFCDTSLLNATSSVSLKHPIAVRNLFVFIPFTVRNLTLKEKPHGYRQETRL